MKFYIYTLPFADELKFFKYGRHLTNREKNLLENVRIKFKNFLDTNGIKIINEIEKFTGIKWFVSNLNIYLVLHFNGLGMFNPFIAKYIKDWDIFIFNNVHKIVHINFMNPKFQAVKKISKFTKEEVYIKYGLEPVIWLVTCKVLEKILSIDKVKEIIEKDKKMFDNHCTIWKYVEKLEKEWDLKNKNILFYMKSK